MVEVASAKDKKADQAWKDYTNRTSCENLIAWLRAELACDADSLRQHGHHDDDILQDRLTLAALLAQKMYEMRTGKPPGKHSRISLAVAA